MSQNTVLGPLGNTSFNVTATADSVSIPVVGCITPVFYPNNSSFSVTGATVALYHPSYDINITVSVQICRCDSNGTILTFGTQTSYVAVTTNNLFNSVSEPSWSSANCSDRLSLLVYYKTTDVVSRSAVLKLNHEGTYLISSIPINGSSCSIARKGTQVIN